MLGKMKSAGVRWETFFYITSEMRIAAFALYDDASTIRRAEKGAPLPETRNGAPAPYQATAFATSFS